MAALSALLRIERGDGAGPALDRALRGVADDRERALATELAYGVTRRRASLDAELRPLCRRPLTALQPEVRAALRLGLYQLRHAARVPPYAAVATSVELARRHARPAAAALVNAVLRRAAAAPPAPPPAAEDPVALAAAHSHPEWLVRRWLARLGPTQTGALLSADNRTPGLTLRANVLRVDGAGLAAELGDLGLEPAPGRWLPEAVRLARAGAPGDLPPLRAGRCSVQDEASMLVAHVAAPRAGDMCLDVAAAPGGKACHLAERMGDRGIVVANDVDPGRLRLCEAAAARLGLRSLRPREGDARALPRVFADRCDVVLVDAPCSGLGSLARRPDLRWRKEPCDVPALSALQEEILTAGARCVKPGGTLVYSTCTTEPEEGEDVVRALLAARHDFAPLDLADRLPAGLGASEAGMLRLWPHLHDTEGFFIAGLRRLPGRY